MTSLKYQSRLAYRCHSFVIFSFKAFFKRKKQNLQKDCIFKTKIINIKQLHHFSIYIYIFIYLPLDNMQQQHIGAWNNEGFDSIAIFVPLLLWQSSKEKGKSLNSSFVLARLFFFF